MYLAPPDGGALLLAELLDDVVAQLARDGDALRRRHHRAHLLLDLLALLLGHHGALVPLDEAALVSQLGRANLQDSSELGSWIKVPKGV